MSNYKKLGILGGMGPIASTEFLKTLYECNNSSDREQGYPDIILHSISSVPDRTTSFKERSEDALLSHLEKNLITLDNTGVSKIVVCCFTSHCLLHKIDNSINDKIISLVSVTMGKLAEKGEPSLLLATTGSYDKHLFTDHEISPDAKQYIILPDDKDKEAIHALIYENLKKEARLQAVYESVKKLLNKYGVTSFIAGCTEFHLLTRYLTNNRIDDISFIDPLYSIATNLGDVLNGISE